MYGHVLYRAVCFHRGRLLLQNNDVYSLAHRECMVMFCIVQCVYVEADYFYRTMMYNHWLIVWLYASSTARCCLGIQGSQKGYRIFISFWILFFMNS
jgi:hypothetical protein